MNEYKRITGMSIEEMSCFFEKVFDGCINCLAEKVCNNYSPAMSCRATIELWLKGEVEK